MSIATTGTAVPRKWPRGRVLLALLAVSAALNLFFIAGAVWTRVHAPPAAASFDQRFQRIGDELNLDPQQRIAFDRYTAAMRLRRENMRRQIAPLFDAARQEIGKPQADADQIFRLLDEAAQKRREFQREAIVQTLDFLAVLSPTQRSQFVAIVRERRAAHLDSR